jgi:hypothetical protein
MGVLVGDAWREQLCDEPDCIYGDRPQHIHCPWGGHHIHVVSDEGVAVETVPPRAG